jgi:hypothetical protein
MYGLDNNYEKSLPENKFLKKYKFVDDNLRLVNKDGHFVNEDGKLIDENGRFVDENGNFVDRDGNRVDADGEYVVDSKPFLDDEGNPVVLEDADAKSLSTIPVVDSAQKEPILSENKVSVE